MSNTPDPEAEEDPKKHSIFHQPWGITWRKALASLPRLVPDSALYLTSPGGPFPLITKLSSRGKHQIPVYIFVPPQICKACAKDPTKQVSCPVVLDFHGGGFVLGSCHEQAPFCSKLCRELGCIVITVDYRLGPHAEFPAANEDAEDVLKAILDPTSPGYHQIRDTVNTHIAESQHSPHFHRHHYRHHKSHGENQKQAEQENGHQPQVELDRTRLAISGFSSGGNLALNLAISLKAHGPYLDNPWPSPIPEIHTKPIPLLLFYPSLDARQLPGERPQPAGLKEEKGFIASLRIETELMPTYLPSHMRSHPRASPGLVDAAFGTIHTSAKIWLVLPQMDSLAEQSAIWIEKIKTEGRGDDLQVINVEGVVHGWTQFPDPWLNDHARRKKKEVFDEAVDVAKHWWHDSDEECGVMDEEIGYVCVKDKK